jgi:hypothetical protein
MYQQMMKDKSDILSKVAKVHHDQSLSPKKKQHSLQNLLTI